MSCIYVYTRYLDNRMIRQFIETDPKNLDYLIVRALNVSALYDETFDKYLYVYQLGTPQPIKTYELSLDMNTNIEILSNLEVFPYVSNIRWCDVRCDTYRYEMVCEYCNGNTRTEGKCYMYTTRKSQS